MVRNGHTASDLADEFKPTETTVRNLFEKTDQDEEKVPKVVVAFLFEEADMSLFGSIWIENLI